MKKKSSDAKLNPCYNSPVSSGGVDRKLIQRVEQASTPAPVAAPT